MSILTIKLLLRYYKEDNAAGTRSRWTRKALVILLPLLLVLLLPLLVMLLHILLLLLLLLLLLFLPIVTASGGR